MSKENGLIADCKSTGCGWVCCDYGQKGHIIMFPGEYEKASGTDHLQVLDEDYHGGKKVRCQAKDTSNCDNGYKPIQCQVYPLWVKSDFSIVKSTRCPLKMDQLTDHTEVAIEKVKAIVNDPSFMDKVKVNSYE